jgi:hypothetical protein
MTITDKFALVARLTCRQPEDLDPLLEPFDAVSHSPGRDLAPCPRPSALPRPRLAAPDAIAVGVLIDRPLSDPADAACRLAALAIEQDVHLVALTTLDYSGLERFGIRTERISGQTAEEHRWCRDQLMQFWGIEVLVPT